MISTDMTRHHVDGQRVERALLDIEGRVFGSGTTSRYGGGLPLRQGLAGLQDELLDHVGAAGLTDPDLAGPEARAALLTAAECALASLGLGCFPDGDWDVPLSLADRTLSSADLCFDEAWVPEGLNTTAATWVRAFTLCVVSGLIRDRSLMIGPLLSDDYAPAIREGVPYSRRTSTSTPGDLAQMDALCDYLCLEKTSRSPWIAPGAVPLHKPGPDKRARAAERLDAQAFSPRVGGFCASSSATTSGPSNGHCAPG